MKVFVKTLKGKYFEIEVNREDKVADVKKKIEANQGGDVYPAAQQMLIHQGKVLEDEMTLNENKVAENSFIVIMLTKNKVSCSGVPFAAAAPTNQNKVSSSGAPIAAAAPTNQNKVSSSGASTAAAAPTSQDKVSSSGASTAAAEPTSQNKVSSSGASTAAATPTSQAQPTSSSLPTLPHPPAPSEAPASTMASSESDVYGEAASHIVAGNNLAATIQQLLEMGGGSWGRDTVIQALRAAYNNPERAVDYLYYGIPEPAEIPTIAQVQAGGQAENPPAQARRPAFPSSGPNSNPLVLFPQGLPDIGSNTNAGTLDFLRHSQQFRAFRAMVQTNPQILQPMLQELGKQNPNLMRLIHEHQADFLRLINEPIEGEGDLPGDLAAAMPQSVTVTLEEREAIGRLESMGFGRALVLEVFFACNKNEELAANYLLDHIHEFEE